MTRFKVAVVGLGRVGAQYPEDEYPRTHVSAYLRNPRCELVAVADPDAGARAAFEERWADRFSGTVFADVGEMMATARPDAVTVCVPPKWQPVAVKSLLGAGVPGALVLEKPFAADAAGAVELAGLLRRAGVGACIHFNRSWDAPHERFMARVKDPSEGRVLGGRVIYTRGMYNYASHLIALLAAHFGKVAEARALRPGQKPGPDPEHSFNLRFEAGFDVHFLGLETDAYDVLDLDLFTEAGVHSLEAGGCRRRVQRGRDGLFYPDYPMLEREPAPEPDTQLQSFAPLAQNVVEFLEGRQPLRCPWQVGLEVMEILEAVRLSLAADGAPMAVAPFAGR